MDWTLDKLKRLLSTGDLDALMSIDVSHWPPDKQEQLTELLCDYPEVARSLARVSTVHTIQQLVTTMHHRNFRWALHVLGVKLASEETTALFDTTEFYSGLLIAFLKLLNELAVLHTVNDENFVVALQQSIATIIHCVTEGTRMPEELPHEGLPHDPAKWRVPRMLDIIVDNVSGRVPMRELVEKVMTRNTFDALSSDSSLSRDLISEALPKLLFDHLISQREKARMQREEEERQARIPRRPEIQVSSRDGMHMEGWYRQKTSRALVAIGELIDAFNRGDTQLPDEPGPYATEEEHKAYDEHPNVGTQKALWELLQMNVALYFVSAGVEGSIGMNELERMRAHGSEALVEM